MKDSVTLIQAELERAVAAHNEAVQRLHTPNGAPYYAPEVMREQGAKARQTLTNALDALHNRAEDIRTAAAATAAAARDDPYSWLNDAELQRAALLALFRDAGLEALFLFLIVRRRGQGKRLAVR